MSYEIELLFWIVVRGMFVWCAWSVAGNNERNQIGWASTVAIFGLFPLLILGVLGMAQKRTPVRVESTAQL